MIKSQAPKKKVRDGLWSVLIHNQGRDGVVHDQEMTESKHAKYLPWEKFSTARSRIAFR